MFTNLKSPKEVVAMKTKHLILMTVLLAALLSIGVTIYAGEQSARYVTSQEKRQLFLAEVKEDITVLSSCLRPHYRSKDMKPEFNISPDDIKKFVPSDK